MHAQDDCFPSDDANESRTFAILSAPLTFSGAGGTNRSGIGIELSSIPNVPDEIATPTTCRPGKGPENTDPVDGIARLRVGLAAGELINLARPCHRWVARERWRAARGDRVGGIHPGPAHGATRGDQHVRRTELSPTGE